MKARRAFTLVEMLVTSTMLALIAMAGFAVFSGAVRSAAKVGRYGAMLSHGQMALEAMVTDIRAAVAYGDYRLVSLDVEYQGRDCDTIDFIIARPNPERKEPDEGGRAEVGYYIDNNPDTEGQWLVRREDRTLDDDPLEGGRLSLAGPFVSELDFEFYDGLVWQSGWDDRTKFPRAVRIYIVVEDEDEVERPRLFCTTVPIMAQ